MYGISRIKWLHKNNLTPIRPKIIVELALFSWLFYKIIRIFIRFSYYGEKLRPVLDSHQPQRRSPPHQAYRQFPA